MSWSVSSIGKPAAVKAALAAQFESAKKSTANVPHEQESVGLVEQIVNGQLDFLTDIPNVAVRVDANGSAYKSTVPPVSGSTSIKVEVTPLYGWVE